MGASLQCVPSRHHPIMLFCHLLCLALCHLDCLVSHQRLCPEAICHGHRPCQTLWGCTFGRSCSSCLGVAVVAVPFVIIERLTVGCHPLAVVVRHRLPLD